MIDFILCQPVKYHKRAETMHFFDGLTQSKQQHVNGYLNQLHLPQEKLAIVFLKNCYH